jgi:TetR/AcrR family transcriptional regulator
MSWGSGGLSADELHRLKRAEVVRAASRFFSRHGYHGTSLAEIAKDLGLTKSALYYYFADKKTLLFDCSRSAHEGALKLQEGSERTALRRLENLCVAYVSYVVDNELGFIMYADIENLDDPERRTIIAMRDRFEARIRTLLREAIKRGEIADNDVKLAGLTLLGALNWIPKWFNSSGELPAADIAARVVKTVLKGLGASDANLGTEEQAAKSAAASSRRPKRLS